MKISKIRSAIEIAARANDAVHIVGNHGIGKSEYISQVAKENGWNIEILQLPILEVSDLVGMPDVAETKHGKIRLGQHHNG